MKLQYFTRINKLYRDVTLRTLLYSLRHAILKLHTDIFEKLINLFAEKDRRIELIYD